MDKSVWDIRKPKFAKQTQDIKTDILIVGGGITGITLAYYLHKTDYKVTLIEQNQIGHGVSRKTTGKLTYLQSDLLYKITKAHGLKIAREYKEEQQKAIFEIINIIKNNNIQCNLEQSPSIIFSNNPKYFSKIKKNLKQLNINYHLNHPQIKQNNVYVNDTFVFHPLKYVYSLANIIKNDVKIYENTRMLSINKNNNFIVRTNLGFIECQYLILCNNYPPFIFPFLFPIKTHLEKSTIQLFKDENKKYNAINIDKHTISIRFHQDKKLYLTNSRNLNQKSEIDANDQLYQWENYDVMTMDYLPFIGTIKPNLFIATGFNTWGMTNSNVAAKIISQQIINNEIKNTFKPYRKLSLTSIINITKNIIYNITAFIQSKINSFDKAKPICPHMYCTLEHNKLDNTWECPCHGSKFTKDGRIIKGPSTKEIKK